MRCDSCGKIIWFWEPTLWNIKSHQQWHDNEKCNPDDVHITKHIDLSGLSADLTNTVQGIINKNKLDKQTKKQQEGLE